MIINNHDNDHILITKITIGYRSGSWQLFKRKVARRHIASLKERIMTIIMIIMAITIIIIMDIIITITKSSP